MSKQLYKYFIDKQVKLLLKCYIKKEIKINYVLAPPTERFSNFLYEWWNWKSVSKVRKSNEYLLRINIWVTLKVYFFN